MYLGYDASSAPKRSSSPSPFCKCATAPRFTYARAPETLPNHALPALSTLVYRIHTISEERWHQLLAWLAKQGLSLEAPTAQTPYAMVDGTGVGYATPFYAQFRRGAEIRRIEQVFGSVKGAYGSYVGSRSWRGARVWVWGMLALWNLLGLVQVGGDWVVLCLFVWLPRFFEHPLNLLTFEPKCGIIRGERGSMQMAKALGIDLGTTNSVVAVVEFPDSDPEVIVTAEGMRTCPSVVAFAKTGERLVGQLAKRQAILNPQNTIYSIKRFIGRRYDEVEKERQMVPYKVIAGTNGMAVVEVEGNKYTPEQISSMILCKLKKDAEAYLGEEVRDVVITVPAYFNDAQRHSTKVAGEVAGFNVLRVLNEPTAAAIAYGIDKQQEGTIVVWDLGGGTFDVTVLRISGDGVFEVRATNGDTHLGGDDWDEALVNYIADQFQREQGIDLRRDPQALQRLREAAEKAKCELSTVLQTTISLPFITADASGPKHLEMTLTRAQFEQITRHLCERMRVPFENALKDAGLEVHQIDDIVLVGGSTRMPMVENLIRELTGKEPRKGINPDEVVAVGAAIQAAVMTGMYKGGSKSIVLVDVLPLSLGVETQGGVMSVMIPRNSPLPYRHSEIYTTARDFQDSVEIKILQGERPMARDNRMLGIFALEGIPPAPKGVPRIEVTFEVDTNGLLTVFAKDLGTGKSANVRITNSTSLSKEEVERMIQDAERHAEEDRKRREIVELRHQLETLCNQASRLLDEYAHSIPEASRTSLADALDAARQQLNTEDLEALQRACNALIEASRQAGEAIYHQNAATASVPETEHSDMSV